MISRAALVIGETPSLGRSVTDLLDSANIPHRLVHDLAEASPLATLSERFPVLIAACNEPFCATARRWARGELPHTWLVVVGARDSTLSRIPGLRTVSLPLEANSFLGVVEQVFRTAAANPPPRPPEPAGDDPSRPLR